MVLVWGLGELCTGTPAPVEILHSKSIIEFHRTYKAVIVKPDPLPNPPSQHTDFCVLSVVDMRSVTVWCGFIRGVRRQVVAPAPLPLRLES